LVINFRGAFYRHMVAEKWNGASRSEEQNAFIAEYGAAVLCPLKRVKRMASARAQAAIGEVDYDGESSSGEKYGFGRLNY
jgi:hypothetical protein